MFVPDEASHFSILDYIVFCLLLITSLAIGVYHGVKGNKTTEDFLLASKDMSPVPIALSLISSSLSSIAILGK